MKKLITLLMSFVLIFSLVGCGSTSETTETAEAPGHNPAG